MKYILGPLLAAVVCLANEQVRYDNYQVYQVIPTNKLQLETLRVIQNTRYSYNFWTDVTSLNQSVLIMVPPNLRAEFQEIALGSNLTPMLKIPNVQTLIDNEKISNSKTSSTFAWTKYQTLKQINDWLRELAKKNPEVTLIDSVGKSYEENNILGIKISFKEGKKGVFIEGGIHAREWISPATVTYIANELLTNPDVRKVAESRDWYIFPVVNPDGYVYTHTTDRIWRKTRKPYGECFGADPNRNWGYGWNTGGASDDPCSEIYAGPKAFSEVENLHLSNYIDTIAANLDTYLAFHAFSQLLLIPYGHIELPENDEELHTIGKKATEVLAKRHGTKYKVGNIHEVIYVASGGSIDWAKRVHKNIRIVYAYELRDTGEHGFILPPEQIIPTGEETLDSLVSIIEQADEKEEP